MYNKRTILFSEMIPNSNWEEEFNNWYDTEHIPIRMDVPGFICARRYKEIDSKKYLAVYEMVGEEVLTSTEYKNIKDNPSELTKRVLSSVDGFTRYIGNQIGEQINNHSHSNPYDSSLLYSVMFQVPREREDEFNEWYEQDHLPTLLKNPDWLACRRFSIIDGEPKKWTHLALHYLSNKDVLGSKEREEARSSLWREKLAKEEWFKGKYMIFESINKFNASSKTSN